MKHMQKINAKILINAPKEKVWHTMLDDATYRIWTNVFHPGSYFKGSWDEGSEIRFIGPKEDGTGEDGMVSRIAKNIPFEYISIEHLGIIQNGILDTTSDEVKKWAPSFENYTFKEVDGKTLVEVDMDIDPEYKQEFDDLWPRALQTLKELAEK